MAATSTAPVISVRGMCTGYAGQPVVHDLSFDVMPGEVLCLLGPNGAGKTTTMLALAGELPLIEGEIAFADVKPKAPLYKRARAAATPEPIYPRSPARVLHGRLAFPYSGATLCPNPKTEAPV